MTNMPKPDNAEPSSVTSEKTRNAETPEQCRLISHKKLPAGKSVASVPRRALKFAKSDDVVKYSKCDSQKSATTTSENFEKKHIPKCGMETKSFAIDDSQKNIEPHRECIDNDNAATATYNSVSTDMDSKAQTKVLLKTSKLIKQEGEKSEKCGKKNRRMRRFTPLKRKNSPLKMLPQSLEDIRIKQEMEITCEQRDQNVFVKQAAQVDMLFRQVGTGSGQTYKGNEPSSTSYEGSGSSNHGNQETNHGNQPEGNEGHESAGGRRTPSDKKNPQIAGLKPCKPLVHKYVIRPAPAPLPPKQVRMNNGEYHRLDQSAWMAVFRGLSKGDLIKCLRVCKTWYRWVMDPSLWTKITLNNTRIKQPHLIGVVKRQPRVLDLARTNISFAQLEWLVARLPLLKQLDLSGNSWAAVGALCSSSCPFLTGLDLSWVCGVFDHCVIHLLSPPTDHRPGVNHMTSRLHHCSSLMLSGCDITDKSLVTVKRHLVKIERIGVSCTKISDYGVEILSDIVTLKYLDISNCQGLTSAVFGYLEKMSNLKKVKIVATVNVSEFDIVKFTQKISGEYCSKSGVLVC